MSEGSKVILKLFVTGQTVRSRIALANLERICHERLPGQSEIHVIDVLENPEAADEHWIIATPTLVRDFPEPRRRMVGDLSSLEKVVEALDLAR